MAIITVTAALSALFAAPRPAHGDSCLLQPLEDYIDRADVIFAGRPVQRIEPNDPSYHSLLSRSEGVTIIFEVDQVFKGQAGPLVAARSSYGNGDYGFPYYWMSDWDAIAVFATIRGMYGWSLSEPGDLQVGLCDFLEMVNGMEEALGPGYPPDETMVQIRELLENPNLVLTETPPSPENAPRPIIYWLIGGAVAALVGGTMLAYRLRPGNRAGRDADSGDHRTTDKQ